MTPQESSAFLSATQGSTVLAGAGVVTIDGASIQVLRQPKATGPKLYLTLYKYGPADRSEMQVRRSVELLLARAGVRATGMALVGVVGGAYTCFACVSGSVSDDSAGALAQVSKAMQEAQMSLNLQYLQLQSMIQHENRSFTAISNIMKTKHDTVKNSISNIR